jgi:hypothetical protein
MNVRTCYVNIQVYYKYNSFITITIHIFEQIPKFIFAPIVPPQYKQRKIYIEKYSHKTYALFLKGTSP